MPSPRSPSLPPITFVIDGELDQPTGGYLYDRLVVDGLRARGERVHVESLRCGGLVRTFVENARFAARRARDPEGSLVVVDELCHPRVALSALLSSRPRTSLLAARPRARLVALVHHLTASERTGLSAHARFTLERPLLTAASTLITTSATTAAVLVQKGLPRERIRTVLPGRDRLGERRAVPLPSPDGLVRLLFIGALTPRKGTLDLVRAFARVEDRATLTLAGPSDRDPAYAARVRALAARAKGAIHLLGTQSDRALAALLAHHDVLVLPSRYEGYGIVLAEALSHGLAIVSTTAGAIPEIVRHGREALLVKPASVPELADALDRLVRDPALRIAMQHAALKRALELPTWAETQTAFAATLAGS